MTATSKRIAELVTKGTVGKGQLDIKEGRELARLLERNVEVGENTERIVTKIQTQFVPVTIAPSEYTLTFDSGGHLDLGGHTLELQSDYVLGGTGGTLNMSGSASLSGVNSGDETLAVTSGLTLTSHVLAVGAGAGINVLTNSVAVDQTFSPTWTGTHTFQNTIVTRHLQPELPDTYDVGTATNLYRKLFCSEIDAIILAQNTKSAVGGWLSITIDEGALPGNVTSGATQIDFGKAMTPGDFLEFRGLLMLEYMLVGAVVTGTTYNVTRNLDGTGANNWPAGAVWQCKRNGLGSIELNSYDTPRIQLLTQGATYNAQTEIIRLGDLNANWGYSSATYGLAIGNYAAGAVNLTMDPTNGYRLRTYDVNQFTVTPNLLKFGSNVGTIAVPQPATTAIAIFGADQTYNGESFGVSDLLIGDNSASKANMLWDKSAGKLLFRGGTTTQLYIDTDGSLISGYTKLNTNGISVTLDASESNARAYQLSDGTNIVGAIRGFWNTGSPGENTCGLAADSVAGRSSSSYLASFAPAGYESSVQMIAYSSTTNGSLEIDVNSTNPAGQKSFLISNVDRFRVEGNNVSAFYVQQSSVHNNVFVVDTTNGAVGINTAAVSGIALTVSGSSRFSSDLVGPSGDAAAFAIFGGGTYNAGAGIKLYGASHASLANVITFNNGAYAEKARMTADGKWGFLDNAPAEVVDVNGNINCTGVIKVDDVQVVSTRYIDDDIDNVIGASWGSGEQTAVQALIAMAKHHGLIAAA